MSYNVGPLAYIAQAVSDFNEADEASEIAMNIPFRQDSICHIKIERLDQTTRLHIQGADEELKLAVVSYMKGQNCNGKEFEVEFYETG